MKIVSIVGARPQFIKAALVCRQLRDAGVEEILVHTGQHYDLNMSDVFFDELDIPNPDYHLGIGSGTHGRQTGMMLEGIENIIDKERPDFVLVYGDTNSTLAGSLAAAKLNIPIAHVEAGLRSYNKTMPEEINRVLTDHVSSVLFCPTGVAVDNLRKEGFNYFINEGRLIERNDDLKECKTSRKPLVINVGDVMYDVAKKISDQVNPGEILNKYALRTKEYILVTIHRVENTDNIQNLTILVKSLSQLADTGINIVFPVHPRTDKALKECGFDLTGLQQSRLQFMKPVSYTDMIVLEGNARAIITDSGGVQKEGYFFKVPCVIPRNETEWVELVDNGWNVVTGIDQEKIVQTTIALPEVVAQYEWKQFFGDGYAVNRIVNVLKALEL